MSVQRVGFLAGLLHAVTWIGVAVVLVAGAYNIACMHYEYKHKELKMRHEAPREENSRR